MTMAQESAGVEKRAEEPLRRLADVLVSGAALVLLSPVFLLVAMAIKLDSPGAVLFRQTRVGKGETSFSMWKFRSMVTGSDRVGPKISGVRDPRITRVGRLLRSTKLDEFPQLWNVLRGEMTLVGPRAEVPEMIRHYAPGERTILTFTPGLTGPGQIYFTTDQAELLDGVDDVERFYVEHQLHEKLALDLEYLRTRSCRHDLAVIWQTALVLLRAKRRAGN